MFKLNVKWLVINFWRMLPKWTLKWSARKLIYKLNIFYVSWSTSELRVWMVTVNMFKPFSNILLTFPRWIVVVILVSCLTLLCCLGCFLQPRGHLLGKSWPLGSLDCDVFLCLHLPIWCPGSGVVLDCIHFWSLPSSLLYSELKCFNLV